MPVAAPLIGAVGGLGAAAMSKPKAQKDPLAYLRPYMGDAAGQAQDLYKQGGPQLYSGSTVADMSGTTQDALQAQIARAQGGNPLVGQAQNFVSQGLNTPVSSQFGAATNPYQGGANPYATSENPFGGASNPFLDQTYDKAFGKSMQSLESQFARGGRNIGSSMPVAGDIATNLASQIYAPAYENERNRQLSYGQQQMGIGATGYENAMDRGASSFENAQNRQLADLSSQRNYQQGLLGYASPLAAQDYLDIAQLRDAGSAYDTQNQAQLSDKVSQFNQQAQQPYANLDAYIQRLAGLAGSTGSMPQQQQSPNYLTAGLGGAMLGSQLFGGSSTPVSGGGSNYMTLPQLQAMGLFGG